VYFLGGAAGSAELAVQRLARELPSLRIAGTDAPYIDLDAAPESQVPIVEKIQRAKPDLLLVGLGAPKQELWIHRHQNQLGATVSLGLGASIDFLAGKVRRAPRFMSDYGFEWLFRLALEPRRLARRYLLRDPLFIKIVLQQLFTARKLARSL
jgi:N-acetylglucosaminyldiphosphoundecaprenol N-acetyl-beta-D-mannosaminyltransferase